MLPNIAINSIKYQWFAYKLLNDKTVLFLTSKHKSFVCTQFKCQTGLFDANIGPY